MLLTDPCSHRMAWRLWAESVSADSNEPTQEFLAVQSKNWIAFKRGRISPLSTIQMGLNCPKRYKFILLKCSNEWYLYLCLLVLAPVEIGISKQVLKCRDR